MVSWMVGLRWMGRFLDLVRTGNRQQDVLVNFRRVIQALEEHIRASPEQWLMFHRVWPDLPTGSAGERAGHNAVCTL